MVTGLACRVQIKVAFAAGLPKTLEALLELFAPENDWQENCEFRAGLEKHLGMPPKGGMSILPTFIATTANPESMELAAAYFSGGPAALLGVVGVDDPSALASWPEPGAPSAAAAGKKDKKTPAPRDESPEKPPPSEPTAPGRQGLYDAEERAAVEAAGGLRFVGEHSLVCWRVWALTPRADCREFATESSAAARRAPTMTILGSPAPSSPSGTPRKTCRTMAILGSPARALRGRGLRLIRCGSTWAG